ncbi:MULTISPECIES: type IV secretion system protein [unclassified Neisseria]|uniref:type IV secretion system protein n=1 Tax=unclassified Neisseria TaxID=2623750 RepID=UPI0026656111|nr:MULTISPECIES: type IV secretion system protein [unclassified Neisseria]MDO1509546.1 type IV secretion system protein [Neisseria sp. MVDL19-042950]MDO1515682.1 type IV secretion system protein [Neisseria sp. MVDL18-041461]MDO1563494.1 type IV secretion system protein [Neisseria sp. MVDL20-010259]
MKINLKKTAGVILSVSMAVMPLTVSAGVPVTNPLQLAQDAANFVKQMAEYSKQLTEMKKQYEQQLKQFKSMTGSRNLGNILKDAVKDQVPSEWSTIYKGAKDIDYKSVINSKGYDSKFADRMTVQNYQEMEKVFDSMKEQLASLDAMMNKINQTQDMKAAADLQNRIAVEQAKIANNQTKLDMLDRLYVRQQELNKRNYAAREACMAKHMASGNYAACK